MRLPITLAITHWNRFDLLVESFAKVRDDERIGEIVIVDDASDDGSYDKIIDQFAKDPKVVIFRNWSRLDCYANKRAAVFRASNPWVILFDSDNVLYPEYVDALIAVGPWEPDHWYLPTFGRPDFDYSRFAGQNVTRQNIGLLLDRGNFQSALNTANHFVHRDSYLRTWDAAVDPGTADSIYMSLRWLEAGGTLTFVPGMEYDHRIHEGSHFRTFNTRDHELFKATVIQRLRELR